MTIWSALASSALTLFAVVVAMNFSTGEKRIERTLEGHYAIGDPQFARSMSALLGPPILAGNRVQVLVNGERIFPASNLVAQNPSHITLLQETHMNYEDRDTFGMYKPQNERGSTPRVNDGPGPRLMGANTLVGNDVYNTKDQDLGDIKEIMLDMHSRQVAYAVLSFGGFLGMGEKLFAVPWSALKLDTENKRFVLDVDKERLQNAPGCDKDNWPDMADESWVKKVHSYYGTKPFSEQPRS